MYGQGNYRPQFIQGHPPFQQPQLGPPPPPFLRAPPRPHPPPSQQVLSGEPPPMYHPSLHPHQSVHGSTSMAPLYPPSGLPCPQQLLSHNGHYIHLPPPPPRMRGEVLYRIPPPPPPWIQHLPAAPPPPSNFSSVAAAPYDSFVYTSFGEAQLPSLPPPPPPPSSPPPLPPPPPPPTSENSEFQDVHSEPSIGIKDSGIGSGEATHVTDHEPLRVEAPRGGVGDVEEKSLLAGREVLGELPPPPQNPVEEEKGLLAGREVLGELPPPPQKPVEEEIIQNIEVTCQYIAKVGPQFEDLARTKESGNPHFAFLFGGEPGSAAAVGHEYFQWMKKKYQIGTKSREGLNQNLPSLRPMGVKDTSHVDKQEDENAVSDMDMEDDKDSPFMEDVSPVRNVTDTVEFYSEKNVKGYATTTSTGDSGLVKVSAAAVGENLAETLVFVDDRSPFRLIRDYASDDSNGDDENAECSSLVKESPRIYPNPKPEDVALTEVGHGLPDNSTEPLTSKAHKEAGSLLDSSIHRDISPSVVCSSPVDPLKKLVDHTSHPQVDTIATSDISHDNETVEGWSTNVDHQEPRWTGRSRSPRRKKRSFSPRSRSPQAHKRAVLDDKDASGSVTEDPQPALKKDVAELQVAGQVTRGITSEIQDPHLVLGATVVSKVELIGEDKIQPLPQLSKPLRAESFPVEASPSGKTQRLINETLVAQPNSDEGTSFQASIQEQPQVQPSQVLPPAPQSPPSPLFPSDNSKNVPFASQHPRENLLPQVINQPQLSSGPHTASGYHFQGVPPPMGPTWSNLPPPPPRHANALPSRSAYSSMEPPFSRFHENSMPHRTENTQPATGPTPLREPPRPQVVEFHHQSLHSVEASRQPPIHFDKFRQMPLHASNPQITSEFERNYHSSHQLFHLPAQGFNLSGPFEQGGAMNSQSLPFPRESPSKPQSLLADLPPRFPSRGEFPALSDLPHEPPYWQKHQASGNFPTDLSAPGMIDSNAIRYPSRLSDLGLPELMRTTHYNPYASTFEQTPARLKLSPSIFGRENDLNYNKRPDSSFGSDGASLSGPGSRVTVSPPNSIKPDEQLVRHPSTGDAYDPLFDSVEPSSAYFKKLDLVKESPVIDAGGTMPKFSYLPGPGDVKDGWQKEDVDAEPKYEAEELGEVGTDAEAGAVENASPQPVDEKEWSPGIPIDAENIAAGEIEVDHVSKRSKDSRLMKVFKVALADFVKEVLKPSWRQGNMSKVAFKTIVKKTVDKVSGSMPGHQVPRSQAKINQYFEASQRKLTKLVMAYVDKYAKP